MPWKSNRAPAAVLAAAFATSVVIASGAPAQTPEFSEQLVIREREIVLDLPDTVSGKALRPGDFQVLVDGQPREVTRAEPLSREGPAPWTVLVYVDRVLASPGTTYYSGVSLGERARDLARLGAVEVAVAASDPDTVLAPTREPLAIDQTLARLAGTARIERDHAGDKQPPPPSDLQVRRQLDKLLAFVASRRPARPHVLFLVADGADLTSAPAAAYRRTADLLAAYGWVVVSMAVRPPDPGHPVSPRSEVDIFREGAGPSGHSISPPPVFRGRSPKKTTLAYPRVVDLFTDPKMATLHTLASTTAGAMVGYDVQLPAVLAELPRRWTISISEPDSPVDGRLHALAVRLPGRKTEARAPAWLRSSTPEDISRARLESLFAGHPVEGDLPLSASLRKVGDGVELRLALPSLRSPGAPPSGPVRISYAFPGQDGPTAIHHETLAAGDLEGRGWRHSARIVPPADARKIAVVVEALGPERWGGAVLDLESLRP
ncbi:MAG TPA: hypothetical protein VGH73_24565 [Thermoanaerobaculia bacterium]|jgi:hypothetical protein